MVAPEPACCYVTTTGRRSGRPHEIEIWFTERDGSLYLISGGADRSDWVRNLQAHGTASVRIAGETFAVTARAPVAHGDERAAAVNQLHAKYRSQVSGTEADWHERAFIVALDRT